MKNEFYKKIVIGGWILLILSVIQIFLLPILIVPLPLLFIPTAVLFIIAALIKKMETAFPSYLNNEKENIIYNLKIASWAIYITAVLPLAVGIFNYMELSADPSFLSSLVNLIGLGVTVIFSLILLTAGFVLKILNYGTKNIHTYTVGYTAYEETENAGEYNNETDYTDAEFTEK